MKLFLISNLKSKQIQLKSQKLISDRQKVLKRKLKRKSLFLKIEVAPRRDRVPWRILPRDHRNQSHPFYHLLLPKKARVNVKNPFSFSLIIRINLFIGSYKVTVRAQTLNSLIITKNMKPLKKLYNLGNDLNHKISSIWFAIYQSSQL